MIDATTQTLIMTCIDIVCTSALITRAYPSLARGKGLIRSALVGGRGIYKKLTR